MKGITFSEYSIETKLRGDRRTIKLTAEWIFRWRELHGPKAWARDRTKWVWVYTFEFVDTKIARKIVE